MASCFTFVVAALLLLGCANPTPLADHPLSSSNEEAIAMAKQECSAALALYGPDADLLEWHVSRNENQLFVGAQRGPRYFMAVFPKFRPCMSGMATD